MKTFSCNLWYISDPHVIILDAKSPVEYSNQTGGCCCNHLAARGYLVPVPLNNSALQTQSDREKYAVLFDPVENYCNFELFKTKDDYECYLQVNGFRMAEIHGGEEAWIFFEFEHEGETQQAVLTWENSD